MKECRYLQLSQYGVGWCVGGGVEDGGRMLGRGMRTRRSRQGVGGQGCDPRTGPCMIDGVPCCCGPEACTMREHCIAWISGIK